jgi:hypothetical protein
VDVWIARGGEIISECPRNDIEGYARNGYFNPDDNFWYEGLSEWGRLDELLSPTTWDPPAAEPPVIAPQAVHKAAAAFPPRVAPEDSNWEEQEVWQPPTRVRPPRGPVAAKIGRSFPPGMLRIAGIGAGALLLVAAILWFAFRPAPQAPVARTDYEPAKDTTLRDRAAADLSARLAKLPPTNPSDPSKVRYRDLRVSLTSTNSPTAPWRATIEGSEDVLQPATGEPEWKTDFLLVVEHDGVDWAFRRYKAMITRVADGQTELVDQTAANGVPPTVAGMLNIAMR